MWFLTMHQLLLLYMSSSGTYWIGCRTLLQKEDINQLK
jgi:hypothetical protein